MSKVSIKVGPKTYTFNTAEGEEAKITALGQVIDSKYQMLGHTRSVQETDNLVFAALFLADELEEMRGEAERLKTELAACTLSNGVPQESRLNGDIEDMQAEIETLRKAEERSRAESASLKAELASLRAAARPQHDLFGGAAPDDGFAEKLEALAARAEAVAAALEATSSEDGLEGGGADA